MKAAIKLILLALLATSFSGCVLVPAESISPNKLSDLKNSKTAVVFYMPDAKINYKETLYRVLWLENKSSPTDASGVWNPNTTLTPIVTQKTKAFGLNSIQLDSIIKNKQITNNYFSGLKTDYTKQPIELPWNTPPATYLSIYPTYSGFEDLRQSLLKENVNYLFEYLTPGINCNAPGYGMVIVDMPSQIRIIDLQNKEVIWTYTYQTHHVFQLSGDLKKLEENNLEKLKEGIRLGLDQLMAENNMGKAFK